MRLIISEDLIEKYPDVKLGVIVARNIDNKGESQRIASLLKEIQAETAKNFNIEALKDHASIAIWRQVYTSFGSKPRDYRCSIEALIRSVLNGRPIRHINKIVDLYNFISLKYIVPVGGEDIDKIGGDIHLRFADGNETFVPLNLAAEEKPYVGEVIYCDSANNVLCRRWNWRESDKTKLTEGTGNAIIVIECFDESVHEATKELEQLVQKFCGASAKKFILGKNNTEAEW